MTPKGLWPQLCQHEAEEAGKDKDLPPLWEGEAMQLEVIPSSAERANASYLLLRTFLSKYSFQPSEMAWFSFLILKTEK